MADSAKTDPKKPATEAPAKAKAEPKPPKPPKYDPKGTITLLKNKDGKQYGDGKSDDRPNAKRANTKSFVWFQNYRDGMTIEELSKAFEKSGGSMNSNLDWDINHKFVQYNPPKAA